jgi:hypothetical protein
MRGRLRGIIASIRKNFFLKKHSILPGTRKVLEALYPNLPWHRVDFYEGLPWFTRFIAPYVTAQALPSFYSAGRFRIYLKKFDESRAQCLADIVHEAFHILQAVQFNKGYGLGFFRGFMVHYNALFLKYGYRQNPFEVPAYDQEYRFLAYCERIGLHGVTPPVRTGALARIGSENELVFREYAYRYAGNPLALAASFVFCLLVALLKPLADLLILLFLLPPSASRKTSD